MKKIASVLGIIVALFTIIGGLYAYDQIKADKKDLLAVELRLDQKIMRDDRYSIQKDIWSIEKQYGTDPGKYPIKIRDYYNKLKFDLKELEKELNRIKGGKKG